MRKVKSGAATLGVLTGLNVLNYVDRWVPAAVLPRIIDELRISDAQAGLVASLFVLSYAVASPIVGRLGDRRPRLPMAAAGVLLWSAATFGSGFAPTIGILLLARAMTGVGEASYAVVTPSLLSDHYPPARRGRAMAIFYAALPVGTALGYIAGGAIGKAFGWRAAFMVVGGPGVLLALALLVLQEPPRGRHDRAAPPKHALPLAAALRELRARRSYLVNTAAQTLYTFSIGGLAHWMPTYFERHRGIPVARAAEIFGGLLVVAGFAGTLLGGSVGDRLQERSRGGHFVFSGLGLVASIPFTLCAVLSPSPAIFWPAMFVTLLLLFLNTAPLNAAMANVLPAHLRGAGFGLYMLSIHLFGDAASPAIIGKLSDSIGLRVPVLAAGLLMGAAGFVLLVGRRSLERDLAAVDASGVAA